MARGRSPLGERGLSISLALRLPAYPPHHMRAPRAGRPRLGLCATICRRGCPWLCVYHKQRCAKPLARGEARRSTARHHGRQAFPHQGRLWVRADARSPASRPINTSPPARPTSLCPYRSGRTKNAGSHARWHGSRRSAYQRASRPIRDRPVYSIAEVKRS